MQPLKKSTSLWAERMKVTVDIVIFTIQSDEWKVFLVKRGIPPFKGQFALPGGFVHEDESLDDAAMRELREATGVSDIYLEQLYSFGDPGRDPWERIVTVACACFRSPQASRLCVGTTAKQVGINHSWLSVASRQVQLDRIAGRLLSHPR
jgi:8-oxo-dGTP diphosphatase